VRKGKREKRILSQAGGKRKKGWKTTFPLVDISECFSTLPGKAGQFIDAIPFPPDRHTKLYFQTN